jgi:hypothetical protein
MSIVVSGKVAGVSFNQTTWSTTERGGGGAATITSFTGTPYAVTQSYRSGPGVLNVVRSRYRSTTGT